MRHMHGTDNLDRTQDQISSSGFPAGGSLPTLECTSRRSYWSPASYAVFYTPGTFQGHKSVTETMRLSRYQSVEGAVDRILGSYRTTDVNITETTSTLMHESSSPHGHHHSETHTFVNTSREFAMLLEVKGYTLKLVSNDYIAVAIGDEVQAICAVIPDAAMRVLDWSNVTRSIRFRTIPMPLVAAAVPLALTAFLTLFGLIFLYAFARYSVEDLEWWTLSALILAGVSAFCAWRTADRMARIHAELDRLAGSRKETGVR